MEQPSIVQLLQERFGAEQVLQQPPTMDGIDTVWVPAGQLLRVLAFLQAEREHGFPTLYDLTAIDERARQHRQGQPHSDFTVVYHLISYQRNQDLRVKVALLADGLELASVSAIWPNANWYEREVWDMFGIRFTGHPNLRRILMPPLWQGHPLRKEHHARATEVEPFVMTPEYRQQAMEALEFKPEEWGIKPQAGDKELMYLNMGPQHPGTHGPFRVVVQLDGEQVTDVIPDIGYHHRGVEKTAERHTWHTFLPYTDRVDYLGGLMNEMAYLTTVEKMAGIEVPERAQVIRIMMAEMFRLSNHLVWFGTYAQDVGQMSPVLYMFTDREHLLEIVEAICGARMHPVWFRLGGTAQDLPEGWREMVQAFLDSFPARLCEYEQTVLHTTIFKARTQGIGCFNQEQALAWGATGPMLRATGIAWDARKTRPYGGYDRFEFEVPTETSGDCFGRSLVHVAEMWQSLRIIQQCVDNMPGGPYKSSHPLTTPPLKGYTTRDVETLIHHFLGVSWGPVFPPGECTSVVETVKGNTSYYAISDGGTTPYRMRVRTPSFAHLQMIPLMSRGDLVADLAATLGSVDFVLSDVDR